jgi:hypothetical protein
MSGDESDSQFSSISQGYNADDELDELIQEDVFDRNTITNEEQKLEQKIKEEREKAKAQLANTGKDQKQIEEQLTQQEYREDYEEEEKASQAVNTLTITINDADEVVVIPPVVPAPPVDPPTAKRIRTPASRYSEYLQEKTIKEAEKEAKKQAPPTPPPEPAASLNASFDSQIVTEQAEQDSFSQATFARSIIIDNIRLEPITPDSQARKIFTDEELTAMTSCYLCGCKFKDRISAKHNERWNYPEDQITASYDHTAPVNFSMVVVRVPSSYGSYEPFEKEFLKLNGKMACFHCNYTKSQRMFITCPKNGKKIKFENFAPNDDAIKQFVKDLWNSKSEWSKDPYGKNTLHECVGNKKTEIDKWRNERIQAITNSAQSICNMIKKNVDQKKVLKRLYYIKLLIAKARELLKTDPYFNNETIKASRRKAYGNRFIIDFVAKAEATDPKFVMPWSLEPIMEVDEHEENSQDGSMGRLPVPSTVMSRSRSPKRVTTNVTNRGNVAPMRERQQSNFSLNTIFNPTFPARSRSRSRKGGSRRKRKTYRRIRLF